MLIWSLSLLYLLKKKATLPLDHPLYRLSSIHRQVTLLCILLLCLSNLYFSYSTAQVNQQKYFAESLLQSTSTYAVQGTVLQEAYTDGHYLRLDIRVSEIEGEAIKKKKDRLVIRLQAYADSEEQLEGWRSIKRGDLFQGKLLLSKPAPPRNPGGFNYKRYLEHQGIYLIGIPTTDFTVQKADFKSLRYWSNYIYYLSEGWQQLVQETFSAEVAAVVLAMTIAIRDQVDPSLLELYQELGVIHLLAISGLHVGILTFGIFHLLLLLRLTREKAYLLLLLFIPIYITLCGFTVSVVRSGLMCMLGIILLLNGWQKRALLIFYVVYILLLLYDPYWIYSIGFQLSFAVTFILLTGYAPLERLSAKFSLPKWLKGSISITLLAQIASLPFLLYHFYYFSPYSFLTNLIVVPFFTLILIPGAFVLPVLYAVLGKGMHLMVLGYEKIFYWLLNFLEWVHTLPFAILHTGSPSFYFFILYLLLVIFMFSAAEKGRMSRGIIYLGCVILLVCTLFVIPHTKSYALVTLLDVGQSDAIVIELPYRREVYLIDAGGTIQFPQPNWKKRRRPHEAGRDIVLRYLRYRGINKIDKLFITHGHLDHLAGLQGLIGKVKIEELYRAPYEPFNVLEAILLHAAAEQGTQVLLTTAGASFVGKYDETHILYPIIEFQPERLERISSAEAHRFNLVLWQRIYNTTLLWTGDLDQKGEDVLLHNYPELTSHILKVGHHGSNTSTSKPFLTQLEPKLALIPVGRNNRYGHPHPDVLQRLEEEQVLIFRTDYHGAIQLYIYPDKLNVRPTLHLESEPIK